MPPKKQSSGKSGLQIKRTTQAALRKEIAKSGAIRVGSTVDIRARANQYQQEGYTGTMSFAPTKNMKKAENKLLQAKKKPIHNQHRVSNNEEKPGFVYANNGRKKSKK